MGYLQDSDLVRIGISLHFEKVRMDENMEPCLFAPGSSGCIFKIQAFCGIRNRRGDYRQITGKVNLCGRFCGIAGPGFFDSAYFEKKKK